MIEVRTESKADSIEVRSSMEGRAIDLMAEGVSIVESLIDDFEKHDIGTEFLFLLASAVERMMHERKKVNDDEGGENLA